MQVQEAIDTLNTLSKAADGFSIRADKVDADIRKLIAAFSSGTLTPAQTAAVDAAKKSTADLAAAGDKVDAAVLAADQVLDTPAPAGDPIPA